MSYDPSPEYTGAEGGIIPTRGSGLRGPPPDWMPDPGTQAFVQDLLEEFFNLDVCKLNEKWVPLTIVSTLDWLRIAMWWFFEYSDVERTNEQYEFVFNFDGVYEFDADKLLVFRDNPDRNAFDERWNIPGLTDEERQDVVGFVNSYFKSFGEPSPPPQEITEKIVWATFIWVLSDYGKDWIYMLEELFGCVQDFKAAFVSAWEASGKLLDPRLMYNTDREVGTCASCGVRQWCVQGYMVQHENVSIVGYSEALSSGVDVEDLEHLGWSFFCNRCAVDLKDAGFEMDDYDTRLAKPMCGNTTCLNTGCPNLPTVEGIGGRKIPRTLVEMGQGRVDKFHDQVKQLGGLTPRQIAGQSADDIVDHFRK